MISIWVQYDYGNVYDIWFWNGPKPCDACKDEKIINELNKQEKKEH